MWLALLLLLWLSPVTPKHKTGSCSQPQSLCCLGTDHRCRRGSCYCDEFCHVVPDCCPDYRSLCDPASQTAKMVLQMVLSMKSPHGPPRSNLDWVKNMVHQLLQTSPVGRPLSMAVKGIKKRA
ncbi:somatomedin-B and thrombospondin type-1 domain-containing protein-like [Dipodomys spectabilis]|uniref:somatomedin-B and thrombospondin type-1 domain-containing protein-like n=1 Tax=Dipodomys spectabilis TaxID=105255 RepID=UPI001C54147B|nr:somatomedin-B and thrombospondin type-1 domain-containing protein-like [Dipodomys spectabilis]XP_042525569.1 somatomedin-B and thrombospondin type-1 domain-containing protein-like [Dipodomys spectabilis]